MSKFAGFIVGAALIATAFVLLPAGVALTAAAARTSLMLIIQGGAMILMQGIADLTMPKGPSREASEMTIALGEQPRVLLIGETFTPGSLVDGFDYGGKYGTDWEVLVIRLADHKCQSLTGFYVNDDYNLYTADGLVPAYDDQLEIYFRADTTSDPLPAIVTANGPKWTAADIGRSGCDVIVAYKADKQNDKHPGWPGGRPRFGFVVKGALCYDPRLDDTVTGGAGPHRWDTPATWTWSANAAICRYKWARGVYADDAIADPSALLVGRGLSADEAPPANIIAAANLCDEDAGGPLAYEQHDTASDYTGHFAVDPTGTWMIRYNDGSGGDIEWWYLANRMKRGMSSGTNGQAGSVTNVALANDGTAYFVGFYTVFPNVFSALYSGPPLGAISKIDVTAPWFSGPTRVFDLAGPSRVILTGVPHDHTGYCSSGMQQVDAACGRDFSAHHDGSAWGIFHPTGSSADILLKRLTGAALTVTIAGLVTRSGPGDPTFCHVGAYNHWFVISDGKWYTVNDDTTGSPGTIIASGAWGGATLNLPRGDPTAVSFWAGFTEISLQDASTIRAVNPSDWLGENTGLEAAYDPDSNAIMVLPQFETHITWRFLDPGSRYRVAGPIYADQQFIDVEQMFAAATAGNTITVEGSVELDPGHAKSIVASFTDDDLLSGSKVSWNQDFLSQASDEWVNTVVPNYIEPAQRWNAHDAPPMRVEADIVADGKAREAPLSLRLVRYLNQAQRVGEIARRLGRLWGRATVTLGPRFCEIEDGDWVHWTSARYFGGGTRTFQVQAYSIDEKWQNTLTLREIAATAYDDDAAFQYDHAVALPTAAPPDVGSPDAGAWALAAVTLTSSGASVPALEVTGLTEDSYASAVVVEYWKSDGVIDPIANPDSPAWITEGSHAPGTTKVDITSVQGGGTYYVAVSYVVSGILGDRRVLGPVTVADVNITPAATGLAASEAIAAESFINIYSASGAKIRNANATNDSKPVNGFAPAAIANGAAGAVQGPGCKLTGLSGLTPGATYYLDIAAGAITVTPPSGSGNLVQEVGVAVSATELLFNPKQGITL